MMKRFLTTTAFILVTAGGIVAYLFFHPHWVKYIFLLIALFSGSRYFTTQKAWGWGWGQRIIFTVITIVLIAVLFILLQLIGWVEYGL